MSEQQALIEILDALDTWLAIHRSLGVTGENPMQGAWTPDEALVQAELHALHPIDAPAVDESEAHTRVQAPDFSGLWARVSDAEGATDGVDAVPESLAQIEAEAKVCERCGLCASRTHVVFGVGDPHADLMFIGEGPGEQEDLRGEPFVGPAGQMLDKMIENVLGLSRERVYIANVVQCRPPSNRVPTLEEASACLPFLRRQIRAVAPKLIVLLGGVALEHVGHRHGITRMRGQEITVMGIPAIPMFHPAYLIRQPEQKRLAFQDLQRIKARYDALGGKR